jgi:hypothetical protein
LVRDKYAWFTDWVYRYQSVTLTLARPATGSEVFDALGAEQTSIQRQTLRDADTSENPIRVRVGQVGDWTYAVEHMSATGADPEVLARLSSNGEAATLCYTATISLFMYARHGDLVFGTDLVVLDSRYGRQPNCFDDQMLAAGFGGAEPAQPQAGALLLDLVCGVGLTADLLERPLPSAAIPAC